MSNKFTSFKQILPKSLNPSNVTYRRSVTFASEIAHKAKLFEQKRKEKYDSTMEAHYHSQMVSLPLIVNGGEIIQLRPKENLSLPYIPNNMDNVQVNSRHNGNISSLIPSIQQPMENDSDWIKVRDVVVDRQDKDRYKFEAIPKVNDKSLSTKKYFPPTYIQDDSSVGSSFHVKWVPGSEVKPLTNCSPEGNKVSENVQETKYGSQSEGNTRYTSSNENQVNDSRFLNLQNSSCVSDKLYRNNIERKRRPSDEGILADWCPENDSNERNTDPHNEKRNWILNENGNHLKTRQEPKSITSGLQCNMSAPRIARNCQPCVNEIFVNNGANCVKYPSSLMYLPPIDYNSIPMAISGGRFKKTNNRNNCTQTTIPKYSSKLYLLHTQRNTMSPTSATSEEEIKNNNQLKDCGYSCTNRSCYYDECTNSECQYNNLHPSDQTFSNRRDIHTADERKARSLLNLHDASLVYDEKSIKLPGRSQKTPTNIRRAQSNNVLYNENCQDCVQSSDEKSIHSLNRKMNKNYIRKPKMHALKKRRSFYVQRGTYSPVLHKPQIHMLGPRFNTVRKRRVTNSRLHPTKTTRTQRKRRISFSKRSSFGKSSKIEIKKYHTFNI